MRRCLFATAFAAAIVAAPLALADDVPMDEAGFTAYVLAHLQPHAAEGASFKSPKPMTVMLKGKGGTASTELDTLHELCAKEPANCANRVDQFVAEWERIFGPPPVPDASRINAQIWLGKVVTIFQNGPVGQSPVAARYVDHLWAVCMNGSHFLVRNDLDALGMDADQAVAICERNSIAAQQPFDGSILKLARGGIWKLSGDGEPTLILMHDLWAPVARRFDGELIVCVTDQNTLYYGHGADKATVAAMEERAKQDAAQSASEAMADHRTFDPDSFHFDVLEWTEKGWDILN